MAQCGFEFYDDSRQSFYMHRIARMEVNTNLADAGKSLSRLLAWLAHGTRTRSNISASFCSPPRPLPVSQPHPIPPVSQRVFDAPEAHADSRNQR